MNHTPVQAVGLDFMTGGFTHSIRFGYTKFRNGIVDAVAGSSIFNPLPGIELAIGSDPDCLTAGADPFCSGQGFLAPQTTPQSDHQIKYDGSRSWGKHIIRYGGGFNHIFGGGFASFLALDQQFPPVRPTALPVRLCRSPAAAITRSTIQRTRFNWATDKATIRRFLLSDSPRAVPALTIACLSTSATPGRLSQI